MRIGSHTGKMSRKRIAAVLVAVILLALLPPPSYADGEGAVAVSVAGGEQRRYADLSAALEAVNGVQEAVTLTLLEDTSASEAICFAGPDMTLDLSGRALNLSAPLSIAGALRIEGQGTVSLLNADGQLCAGSGALLTVRDCAVRAEGTEEAMSPNGCITAAEGTAQVRIENGAVIENRYNNAVRMEDGELSVTGGRIKAGSEKVAVLYGKEGDPANNAICSISDGVITGGYGALEIHRGNWTISGGTFEGTDAMMSYGAFFAENSEVLLNGGRFKGGVFGAIHMGSGGHRLAPGKALQENADTGYTEVISEPGGGTEIGQVTLTYRLDGSQTRQCENFADAVDAMNALDPRSEEIVLTLNGEVASTVPCDITRSCTLDLNGHVYTHTVEMQAMETPWAFLVKGNTRFAVTDRSREKNGRISAAGSLAAYAVCVAEPIEGSASPGYNAEFVLEEGHLFAQGGLQSVSVSVNAGGTATIEGGSATGQVVVMRGTLNVSGGKLESDSAMATVQIPRGTMCMSGGAIVNADTASEPDTGRGNAVSFSGDPESPDGAALRITGGTLSAIKGSALAVRLPEDEGMSHIVGGEARLMSQEGSALMISSGLASADGSSVAIEGNAALHGGTCALALSGIDPARTTVSVSGGYFHYNEDFIPILNSAAVTYPADMVLNTKPESAGPFAGYYTLTTKESLKVYQGENNEIELSYQDFTGLEQTLSASAPAYEAGNEDHAYSDEFWIPFAEAYREAVAVKSNPNANQNEIDYRSRSLTEAMMALEDSLTPSYDVKNLPNGTYQVEIVMWNAQFTATSMADGAIGRTAELTVQDGTGRLAVRFRPLYAAICWGAMTNLWVYNGSTPQQAASNANNHPNQPAYMTEAGYGDYYSYNEITGEVTAGASGPNPGTAYITLPYMGVTGDENKIYCQVAVDAMTDIGVGNQNVILYLKWSTLKAIHTTATLSLDTDEVALIAGGSQAVAASLAGADGYAVSWKSDDDGVATVTPGDNGAATIAAIGAGEATVTVTAAKDGDTALEKTIAVTVAPQTAESVKLGSVDIQEDTAVTALSGDTLVTNNANEGIKVEKGAVVIDAAGASSAGIRAASVVIPEPVARALTGRDVTVKTSMGNVRFDQAAVARIADSAAGGRATLTVRASDRPEGVAGAYVSFYDISLTNHAGAAVSFSGGGADIAVPCDSSEVRFAYHIKDGKLSERRPVAVSGGLASWSTDHFSLWGLSANEYQLGDAGGSAGGGSGGIPGGSGFFLEDGNYYVDINLWKAAADEASMGDVAFKNNGRALVTVSKGKITKVQVATNPVNVDQYHSAIIRFTCVGGNAKVKETGLITTRPAGKTYEYIKRVEFDMPDGGQPDIPSAVTYVDVQFYVPDTPMDAAVGETLEARLRFSWRSATKTDDVILPVNTGTATGTSSLTGQDIKAIYLSDKATGICLETDTERLDGTATLSVSKLTAGSVYENAAKAMKGTVGTWSLYRVAALVDGKEASPRGTVTLSFPSDGKELTIYRINDGGTRTVLKGSVAGGYYIIRTSSLGHFAIVGELGENRLVEDIRDSVTGIRLTSAKDVLPDGTSLKVAAVTAGGVYDGIRKGLDGKVKAFRVYTVSALTKAGQDIAPAGAFQLTFPVPEGYAVNRVAIYRLDGGALTELPGNRFVEGKTCTVDLDKLGTFVVAEKVMVFTDIERHWAREHIERVVGRGLFAGTGETTFSPDAAMTRGMFVTVLGRLAGADIGSKETNFTDVSKESWYAAYVAWAVKNNIVTGTSATTFHPDAAITRQEMAVMLSRYAAFAKIKLAAGGSVDFGDRGDIAPWARTEVDAMSAAKLLNGVGGNSFMPLKTATRAEVATLLARFITEYSL